MENCIKQILDSTNKIQVPPEEEIGEIVHWHCETCIKVTKCSVQRFCVIIACELNCGSRFHACKLSEHRLLCPNEKVACINAGNGCPVVLMRHQRASHLETCPASVVICTMEWNRWPVCSQERQMHVPFHVPNPRAKEGQLDIALALRDQRMLNEWMKVPRRTRRVLRNSLTKCFPAVPLQSCQLNDGEGSLTDDDGESIWDCKKAPPGLQSSVCGELYKSRDMVVDLDMKPRNCDMECGLVNRVKKHAEDSATLNSYQCHDGTESQPREPANFNVCFVNSTQVSEIFSASMMDHAASVIPPPPSSPPMIVSLGLDLTLESITRYQTKPKNMYTFLCAKEFRRDEYSWHYKNVHSDIHGGLNGWLEHRCPLAHYGCMYSLRRFYPTTKGSTIIHDDTLESFGVKPYVPYDIPVKNRSKIGKNAFSEQCNGVCEEWSIKSSLCQLPFEVLRHVCRFLDSFSLCNFALTCRHLREVCCSLLEERGLVVQQWRRRVVGSRVTWVIAYKRWFFSTAFTPVQRWGFEAQDHMSNHLKSCACFERNVETKPYFHIFGCEPEPTLYAKLIAGTNTPT